MQIEAAVAKAVRAALAAALPCQVYDHPPRDAAKPFVTFDRHICQPDDDISEQMSRHQITLAVWSETRGPKEVRDIIGGIRKTLHYASLSLDAGESVKCEVERADATRDADGVTYMGTVLISVLTDNTD